MILKKINVFDRASPKFITLIFLLLNACVSAPFESGLRENAFKKTQAPVETNTQEVPIPRLNEPMTFIWPLKDGRVTQAFRFKRGKKRGHKGIDIAAPKGSTVYASHDGTVIYAGRKFRGFGKFIIVESENGRWGSFYSHLFKMRVKQGQRVVQGQVIGDVGRTGRATGYHLHFEIRKDKEPIDPLTVLP